MTANAFSARYAPAPAGWETVTRFAPIRLGPDLRIHNVTVHASLGITGVDVNADGDLVIRQDWAPGELIGYAKADTDYQLVGRDVYAGCSGGAASVVVRIVRRATNGNLLPIAADSSWFGALDNLWFTSHSIRPGTGLASRARRRLSRQPLVVPPGYAETLPS